MIFKNHEKWQIPASEKKEFEEAIGKRWPVIMQWCPEKVRPSQGNRIPDQPQAMPIMLSWSVNMDNEACMLTYAKSFAVDPKTKTNKYNPTSELFTGHKVFNKEDYELAWFIWRTFPALKGGKNSNPKTPNEVMFKLPFVEKKEAVDIERKLNKAKTLILDEKNGLSNEDKTVAAKALFISNVDEMDDNEITHALLSYVNSGKTLNEKLVSIEKFLSISSSNEEMRVRSILQEALDRQMIVFDTKSRAYWMHAEGKKVDPPLCKVAIGQSPKTCLYEVMATNMMADKLALLEHSISSMKRIKKGKADEGNPDKD